MLILTRNWKFVLGLSGFLSPQNTREILLTHMTVSVVNFSCALANFEKAKQVAFMKFKLGGGHSGNLQIFACRLGRHGKVFLTVPSQSSTDEQKFIQKGEAPGTESLFDIDPQDLVFFVGGVPPDVKVMSITTFLQYKEIFLSFRNLTCDCFFVTNQLPPPLILAPFVGCIELSSINNDVISLYNFKQTHKINVTTSPPCPR